MNKVLYTGGTFDLFHYGHVNFLKKCHSICDNVVVALNTDEFISQYKSSSSTFNDLHNWFTNSLGIEPEKSHLLLDKEYQDKLLTSETDQNTNVHKKIYRCFDEDNSFITIYQKLLSEICQKYRFASERLIVQSFPTIRLQFPGNISIFEFTNDCLRSHPSQEINTVYAVTECRESTALWLQKAHSSGLKTFSTFAPLNLRPGEYAQLDTANKWHGDTPNLTEKTRLSMDFRILKDESSLSNLPTVSGKRKISIGSYYRYYDTYTCKFI